MDAVTLAMAKKYADSQRIAYSETRVLTYDGNAEGKDTIIVDGNSKLVKISDEPVDFLNVIEVNAIAVIDGLTETIAFRSPDIKTASLGDQLAILSPTEDILVMSVLEDTGGISRGVYVLEQITDNNAVYVASVAVDDIRKIDPKFLPGAFLPVVTLNTTINIGNFVTNESGVLAGTEQLSTDDSEMLNALNFTPCIINIKFQENDDVLVGVSDYFGTMSMMGKTVYTCFHPILGVVTLAPTDGVWVLTLNEEA